MKQTDLNRANALSAERTQLLQYLNEITNPPKPTLDKQRKPENNAANTTLTEIKHKWCIVQAREEYYQQYNQHYSHIVDLSPDFVKLAIQMKLAEIERELVQLGVVL